MSAVRTPLFLSPCAGGAFSLSLWERVRVRALGRRDALTPALSQREREQEQEVTP